MLKKNEMPQLNEKCKYCKIIINEKKKKKCKN